MSLVVPNRLNTLSFPFIGLPLMEKEKDALVLEAAAFGLFEIYVPSNHGGRLVVGFGKEHADAKQILFVDAPDGTRTRMGTKQRARIEIADGTRGDGIFRVYVIAPSGAYSIFATFDEVGFAREKDGTPLIPWNFWYFPFSHAEDGNAWSGTILHPLERYEKAFGASQLTEWEHKHHADPTKKRRRWEGHCHNAAAASILFEEPPEDGIEHNGVRIRCEELKFYAAEFFGRFGTLVWRWSLPGTDDGLKTGIYHTSRPSDDPVLFGGSAALGEFLTTVRVNIRDAGHALRMDLRDEKSVEHDAVWNHAVYRYSTRYWQSHPDDLGLVEAQMMLNANDDVLPGDGSCSGTPAEIVGAAGDTRPQPNDFGHDEVLHFRMRFDARGKMDTRSPDNEWSSVRVWNGLTRSMGLSTFAPRGLYFVSRPTVEPGPLGDGNPHIRRDDVLALLRLRERFT